MGIVEEYSDLEFDEDKYYLGKLCKNKHEWANSGGTLRKTINKNCMACERLRDKKKRENDNRVKVNNNLLSNKEAAKLLGIKGTTLSNWRSSNRGPKYLKIGGNVWYTVEYIEEYIKSCVVNPEEIRADWSKPSEDKLYRLIELLLDE